VNERASGFSERDLIRAIESNGEEFLLALGRAAGAEERDDGRIRWVIGNSPIDYHNCVVRADLSPEETDEVILESLERFRVHGVPGSWHTASATVATTSGWQQTFQRCAKTRVSRRAS
jgi:hypothetical protein